MSAVELKREVAQLKVAINTGDWFPEEEGFIGMQQALLRKMRRDPVHNEGWRYRPTAVAVDTKNRVVRRNIIWSKTYLLSLYVQP